MSEHYHGGPESQTENIIMQYKTKDGQPLTARLVVARRKPLISFIKTEEKNRTQEQKFPTYLVFQAGQKKNNVQPGSTSSQNRYPGSRQASHRAEPKL